MYINNSEERQIWVRFAVAAMDITRPCFARMLSAEYVKQFHKDCESAGMIADQMLEEYRKRAAEQAK